MSRTVCAPPTDRALWRKLVSLAHPDAHGDDALFVWANNVRQLVCEGGYGQSGQAQRTGAEPKPERIPFEWYMPFEELTRRALRIAKEQEHPFRGLLELLSDCVPADHGQLQLQENRGATYKQLALIAHEKGLSQEERKAWYRIAETIPLSQRHAGHIISKLQDGQST
jgi:uncharacterized protein YbaR (Trm112 family)